jgi:hypothetical protein
MRASRAFSENPIGVFSIRVYESFKSGPISGLCREMFALAVYLPEQLPNVSRPAKALEQQLVGVALRIGKSGEPACEVPALMHEREIKRNFAFADQNLDSAIGAKAVVDFMNVGARQGRRFRFGWWAPCPKSIARIQVISVRPAAGA